jgi:hypothetical protein
MENFFYLCYKSYDNMKWMMSSDEITREIIDKLGDRITPSDEIKSIIADIIHHYISERDDIIEYLKEDLLNCERQHPNFD